MWGFNVGHSASGHSASGLTAPVIPPDETFSGFLPADSYERGPGGSPASYPIVMLPMYRTARQIGLLLVGLFVCLFVWSGCDDASNPVDPDPPEDPIGRIPSVVEPEVSVETPGEKITQLIGDFDRERQEPTPNRTFTRYQLRSSDLGVPFRHAGRTYILFGDTHGAGRPEGDAIAYTTDEDPEDGLSLTFVEDDAGIYQPVTIPGLSQDAFEVPMEGVEVDGKMYVYHTTDHSPQVTMGRSVLARSDDGGNTFTLLYDFSRQHFINLSIVKAPASEWEHLPANEGEGLIIFGSGRYRESDVYLAFQPASEIETRSSRRYFAGIDDVGDPLWNADEQKSVPLFEHPCVGELSASYNEFIKKWILLYNCGQPRGITMRTADFPWGPWTRSQILFHPWDDGGYCEFIHVNWQNQNCDSVHDPGRENEWGGEYGPYQFEDLATGDEQSTTIYFTLSTWNPYTVVLMKARLRKDQSG